MAQKPDTAETLRQGIDHGQAADKVDYPDPAAAPLGTDAEAGGNPVTPREAKLAHEQEIRNPPSQSDGADAEFGSKWRVLFPIALVVGVLLLLLWVYF
nr:hypothetical protein [Paracoccus saliphilus]